MSEEKLERVQFPECIVYARTRYDADWLRERYLQDRAAGKQYLPGKAS